MRRPEKVSRQSYSFKTKTKTKALALDFKKGKTQAELRDDKLFVERLIKDLNAPGSKAYFYKCLKFLSKGQLLEIEGRALNVRAKGRNPLYYFIKACQEELQILGVR